MKNYMVQFYAPDFGWVTSKQLPEGTSSKILAENTMKASAKKNPRKKYRLIEFNIVKEVEPKLPPLTLDEQIKHTAEKIFSSIVSH